MKIIYKMQEFFAFLRTIVFISALGFSYYSQEFISIKIGTWHCSISLFMLVATFIVTYLFVIFSNRVIRFFKRPSSSNTQAVSAFSNAVASAISAMITKDVNKLETAVQQMTHLLKDAIVTKWFQAHLLSMRGDNHKATAMLYSISAAETNTLLGDTSLCSSLLKRGDNSAALDCIKSMVSVCPNAITFIKKAIVLCLNQNKFEEIDFYLEKLKKAGVNISRLQAICMHARGTYFVEESEELFAKIYKMCPEFFANSVDYANLLIKSNRLAAAQKVLLACWEKFQHPHIFDMLMLTIDKNEEHSEKEKIKLAEKLAHTNDFSWLGYYKFAELCQKIDMLGMALKNSLEAYSRKNYSIIVTQLVSIANAFEDPKPTCVSDILNTEMPSIEYNFCWNCNVCGNTQSKWVGVCNSCNSIDSFQWSDYKSEKAVNFLAHKAEEITFSE